VLNEAAARALQTQAAMTDTLAGLSEDRAATTEGLEPWTACDQPIPVPDQRMIGSRRVFRTPPGTPTANEVEVAQTTVVHRSATAAATGLAATFDLLETCPRSEVAGQVTEGWSVTPVPAGVELEARAATATMTVTASGDTFAVAHGCVSAGPVEQCVTVRTTTPGTTDLWFEQAFVATSDHLAGALLR
jgi:hypothetical protein